MDKDFKVTTRSDESSFADLVQGDWVISIPLFQRRYKWTSKNFDLLLRDAQEILAENTESEFLGVIITSHRPRELGKHQYMDVVDGQQRLTTLYLAIMAAAEVGANKGITDWSANIISTYLVARDLDCPSNTRLIPSFHDRKQFRACWDKLLNNSGLKDHPRLSANQPRPPAPNGPADGELLAQYKKIVARFKSIYSDVGESSFISLIEIILSRLSVVEISLNNPFVAPRIFERMNSRGEKITVADLVRNEIFAKASEENANHAHFVFANRWEPFNKRFESVKDGFEKFLFPYGLNVRRTATKETLFGIIRNHWHQFEGPEGVISDMERYLPCFLAIDAGLPYEGEISIRNALEKLHRMGRPVTIYAFVFPLVIAVENGAVDPRVAAEVLGVLESFLVRRALCGIEPTGLHAVFKGLWFELTDNRGIITAERFEKAIRERSTVSWPSDDVVKTHVKTGNLYGRAIRNYVIAEFEASRRGETPGDNFEIEHIIPQTPTPCWQEVFGGDYEKVVNTWANLIPITRRMNVGASQSPFSLKREEYQDSMFATTRELARTYEQWTPSAVAERAEAIASWAVERWPD